MNANTVKSDIESHKEGRKIFSYFVLFFGLIVLTNGIFVYYAVNTHTGVVTKKPYEKGLAFNELLSKAAAQPDIDQQISYKDGALLSVLKDENGAVITNATVHAQIVRPVQDGYDFQIELFHQGGGVYKADIDLPLRGLWLTKVSSQWNNKHHQISAEIMKP